jgi:hypothetical protein
MVEEVERLGLNTQSKSLTQMDIAPPTEIEVIHAGSPEGIESLPRNHREI